MKKAIIGKKLGMTQIFGEKGVVIPVTVIEAGPCTVVQVKTEQTDGYNAVKLGFGEVKEKHLTKPEKGQFTKIKVEPKKHLREFRLEDVSNIEVGSQINVLRPSEARMRAAYYRRKKLAEEPVLPQLLQNFACGRVVHSSAHSSTVSTMARAMVLRSPSSIM